MLWCHFPLCLCNLQDLFGQLTPFKRTTLQDTSSILAAWKKNLQQNVLLRSRSGHSQPVNLKKKIVKMCFCFGFFGNASFIQFLKHIVVKISCFSLSECRTNLCPLCAYITIVVPVQPDWFPMEVATKMVPLRTTLAPVATAMCRHLVFFSSALAAIARPRPQHFTQIL